MSVYKQPGVGLGSEVVIIITARVMSAEIGMDMVPGNPDLGEPDKFVIEGFDVAEDVKILLRDSVELIQVPK
jgi:hypothetical protein